MTLQKIATITFLDTSCLMSNFTVFFLDKKHIFSGRARAGKIFQLGALPPMPPGFVPEHTLLRKYFVAVVGLP